MSTASSKQRGIACPECGHDDRQVLETRPRVKTRSIYRRCICLRCGARFPTSEVLSSELARSRPGPAAANARRLAELGDRLTTIQRNLDRLQCAVNDLSRLL